MIVPGLARGQAPAPRMRMQVPCMGQRVDAITVITFAPTLSILNDVPMVSQVARSVHATTDPELIRRFLLLKPGDACDELRRAESERILRVQPYISDAEVATYADTLGGVELEVRTSDEASLVAGARFSLKPTSVRGARLGSSNLAGKGIYLAGSWEHVDAYRDALWGRYVDNQFLGHPYTLSFTARRDRLGGGWDLGSEHPFYTDIQRIAWRVRGGQDQNYVGFSTGGEDEHSLRVDRQYFDIGGIVRLGTPGRLSLFGASLSGEHEIPDTAPVLITPHGLMPDPGSELAQRYTTHHIARANLLWGVRDIAFRQVQGVDALHARQDLPIGFQLGMVFGRSLSVIGSGDDDIFTSGDLYMGFGGERAGYRMQMSAEARRDNQLGVWDGILLAGGAEQHLRVAQHHTLYAMANWSVGWRQRVPFRFTLSDPDGGVAGYSRDQEPGGQRGVLRLEHRGYYGRVFRFADIGSAFFVEGGRLWAGDVPYGVTTPIRGAAGVSLLAAVPPGSARLWRLDVAVPVTPHASHSVEVRISSSDWTNGFWREPDDVHGTRERTVPGSVFGVGIR